MDVSIVLVAAAGARIAVRITDAAWQVWILRVYARVTKPQPAGSDGRCLAGWQKETCR